MGEISELLKLELRQLWEEGYDVESLKASVGGLQGLLALATAYPELSRRPGFGYEEPSSLEGIRRLRPGRGQREYPCPPPEELGDRVLGGWVGRAAGCMLGKPVEGWDRRRIRGRLLEAGEYPLKWYFPPSAFTKEELREREGLVRGDIRRVERDDDIDYTILNLLIYRDKGPRFTTEDVAEYWLSLLPYHAVYTAERAAYRNLVLGIRPPLSAVFLNPYREWIGAQIRADLWGYVCPGRPEEAAELAYRDARLSHVKNGIYGEMFVAACVAAAFSAPSIEEVVEAGLSQIPATSRYYEAVSSVLSLYRRGVSWDEAIDRVVEKYGFYHPVHVLNNAAVVVAALLWGEGDFSKTVTYAVMAGWDTDCNGATAGSIAGVYLGFRGIPRRWWEPLSNTVRSAIQGMDYAKLTELADMTVKSIEKWSRARGT